MANRSCLTFNLVKGQTLNYYKPSPTPTSIPKTNHKSGIVHNIKHNNNVLKVINPSKEQVLRNIMNHNNPNLRRGGGCGCGGK
jgi:hypothetical protein